MRVITRTRVRGYFHKHGCLTAAKPLKEKKSLSLPLLPLSLPRLSLPRPRYQKPLPIERYTSLQSLNRLQCCHAFLWRLSYHRPIPGTGQEPGSHAKSCLFPTGQSGQRLALPHSTNTHSLHLQNGTWALWVPSSRKGQDVPWASSHTKPSHPRLAC